MNRQSVRKMLVVPFSRNKNAVAWLLVVDADDACYRASIFRAACVSLRCPSNSRAAKAERGVIAAPNKTAAVTTPVVKKGTTKVSRTHRALLLGSWSIGSSGKSFRLSFVGPASTPSSRSGIGIR
eukprot:scaffold4510_cov183-Amphora_coffeaeformis.AAC.61